MIKSKTVFVIGAGASAEVSMPVGSQLADIIAQKLHLKSDEFMRNFLRDTNIHQILAKGAPDTIAANFKAAQLIHTGVQLSNSIDDFIDSFPHNPSVAQVGKLAIASAILEAEHSSNLRINSARPHDAITHDQIRDSWFPTLMKVISSGVSAQKPEKIFENLSFVVFNYDRCIEHFLLHAVKMRFGLTWKEADQICSHAKIYHPYGSLGDIGAPQVREGLPFGKHEFADLFGISKKIRTYSESIEDESAELKLIVLNAQKLVFLGSSFHEQNLRLLLPEKMFNIQNIFATTKMMSESDRDYIRNRLGQMIGFNRQPKEVLEQRIILSPEGCSNFMNEYQRSIAA